MNNKARAAVCLVILAEFGCARGHEHIAPMELPDLGKELAACLSKPDAGYDTSFPDSVEQYTEDESALCQLGYVGPALESLYIRSTKTGATTKAWINTQNGQPRSWETTTFTDKSAMTQHESLDEEGASARTGVVLTDDGTGRIRTTKYHVVIDWRGRREAVVDKTFTSGREAPARLRATPLVKGVSP
jgi:hypothetical protein